MQNFISKLILTIVIVSLGNYNSFAQSKAELLRQIATDKSTTNWLEIKENTNLKADELISIHKKALGLGNDDDLQLLKSKTDNLGMEHKRFQQFYAGVEVEGAIFVVHEKNGRAEKANGHLSENIEIDVIPSLNEIEALEQALFHIDATAYAWESESMERALQIYKNDAEASFYPTAKLVVLSPDFSPELTDYQLAYKFDIYANEPHERWHIYVDAHTGDEILRISQICSLCENTTVCTGESHHNGTPDFHTDLQYNYSMRDCDRNILTYDSQNTDNFYSDDIYLFQDADCNFIDERQKAGVDVHWATAQTYDFFNDNFGCAGFDCNGNAIQNWVHFGPTDYNNAFYNGLGFGYGDGDGFAYHSFTAIDVVAHEFTHGITDHSAGLIYAYEAGALNESFSDIFGAVIEYQKHHSESAWQDGDHWEIGERVTINGEGLAGIGLRSLRNPNALASPDTYEGYNWQYQINCFANPFNDFCGIHKNSGVQNYWFYLLSEGGNGTNDNNFDYVVNGIGIEKAAQIAYNSLTNYLTPTSTYFDARQAAIWAAEDLFGASSIEVQSVNAAWCAVGLGNCNNSSITLTSPNGGEVLEGGTIYEITWNSDTIATPFVKLTYSSNNGLSWKWIINSVENDGNYDWFVPNILSSTVLVRIQDADNPALIDVSNAVFTIDGCGTESYFELADDSLNGNSLRICQGETLAFINYSEGSTHVEWLVNDELVSHDENFEYTFNQLLKNRYLLVSNNDTKYIYRQKVTLRSVQMQGEDTLCFSICHRYVDVVPQPQADFTTSLNNLTAIFYAPLIAHENDNTAIYSWDFGNGTTSNERHPTYIYDNIGTYNVCLTMENSCNSETVCKDIAIELEESACEGNWVNYTNTNNVKGMVEQNDSILWIGTSGGLVRYNKLTENKTFYNSANSGLMGNGISSLDYRAIDNTLWLIINTIGLCKLDLNTEIFTKIELPEVNGHHVNCVLIDSENNIWVSSSNPTSKIVYATNEVITYDYTNSNLPNTGFYQIEMDIQNNIWLKTFDYVVKMPLAENLINGNNWTIFSKEDFGISNAQSFSVLKPDLSYNKVWIRTQLNGHATNAIVELRSDNTYTLHENLYNLTDVNDIDLWHFNNYSLTHLKEGVENSFSLSASNYYNNMSIFEDNIYLNISNNDHGFIKFDINYETKTVIDLINGEYHLPQHVQTSSFNILVHTEEPLLIGHSGCYFINDNTNVLLSNYNMRKTLLDEENNLWFTTYTHSTQTNHLFYYDFSTDVLTTFDFSFDGLKSMTLRQNGNILIGTDVTVIEYNPNTQTLHDYHLNLSDASGIVLWDVLSKSNGDIWVATSLGAYQWNGNVWNFFASNHLNFSHYHVFCIEEDHYNNLWLGSFNGVAKFDGISWTNYTTENSGLAGNHIREIKTHSNGDVWILTTKGLTYFDGINWKTYTSETSGLPTNDIDILEVDHFGNAYFGGFNGSGLGILYNSTNITPSFTASSESICQNQAATFTSTSMAEQGTLSYTWLIDGVETSNTSVLTHNFTEAGTYIVALIVDNGTCENSISKSINVTPSASEADVQLAVVGCGEGTVTLDANIDNVAAYSWKFNEVVIGNTKTIEVSQVGIYILEITDNCGDTNSYSIEAALADDCVFAGDANYDGICNNYDVLALGIAFHEGGPARAVQLTNWEGYYCPDWQGTQADGINFKHADCNGDGFVNSNDFAAIDYNYGQTHDFSPNTPTNISSPIQLTADNTAVQFSSMSNSFTVPIDLQNIVGNTIAAAGLAFDVQFAVNGANVSDAHFNFGNSDLGANNETLSLSKYFPDLGSTNSGRLEVALIRKDQSDVNTQRVAELEVMVEEISTSEPLELMIQVQAGAQMINNNYILPINATTSTLTILEGEASCDIPTNLHESDLTSSSVTLNWNDMNAEKYRLVGRKKNTPTWKVFDAQTNNFKTFANGLEANACYEWSVRAKCDGIWTDWQDIREFCTPSAKNQNYIAANDPFLSENQETIISDLNVYPNPTSDYINLNFTSTTTEDLQLFLTDILGKTIFSKTLLTDKGEQNIRFQVSDLPKGTYFLQIVNNEEIISVQKVSVL